MISAEQLRTFEERGAVTIDTPLTTKEIAAAAAAIDALLPFKAAEPGQAPRFRYGATCHRPARKSGGNQARIRG